MKFNHYRIRDYKINNELVDERYPYCNSVEDWQHVVRCPATHKFIIPMKEEITAKLKKVPNYNKDEEYIIELIDEIEAFLRIDTANRTNQTIIRFIALFR